MQLSDGGILLLRKFHPDLIDPFELDQLQPATYDLTLGPEILAYIEYPSISPNGFNPTSETPLSPKQPAIEGHDFIRVFYPDSLSIKLRPGRFFLGSTIERVHVPRSHAARIEGKSSLGRLGLIVHSTAGFIDPGFEGNITLEMTNLNSRPILLSVGMRIAQISFVVLDQPALYPYGSPKLNSHYQGQSGVQPHKA